MDDPGKIRNKHEIQIRNARNGELSFLMRNVLLYSIAIFCLAQPALLAVEEGAIAVSPYVDPAQLDVPWPKGRALPREVLPSPTRGRHVRGGPRPGNRLSPHGVRGSVLSAAFWLSL